MIIVILGAQGSGKGTVGVKVAEELGLVHISTGDIFRENIKNETELGKEANTNILAGNLVPDERTNRILMDRLSKEDVLEKGAMIDGYPRTEKQCHDLDEMLKNIDRQVDLAINLAVDYDELISRITTRRVCKSCKEGYNTEYNPPKVEGVCNLCGGALVCRKDDAPETVLDRLNVYHQQTEPLKGYYEKTGKLKTVEGQEELSDTTALVFQVLGI
jgi:adenylate kinase